MSAVKVAPDKLRDTARQFFDACETGQGWHACRPYCTEAASFSAQAEPLEGVDTIEAYAEWMKGTVAALPDARYEIQSVAFDEDRGRICIAAVFHGTHTGEGGPVEPTGESVASDYAFVLDFENGRVSHCTKIWNAAHAVKQLGWA